MPGRGTTDAIFAAKQVIEKHRDMQKELQLVFIYLEKAYDRVQLYGRTFGGVRGSMVFLKSMCAS